MIPNDDKITSIQVGVFIFNTILGVGILTLPASLAKEVKSDAWLVAIVSGILNIIFIYFMCRIGVKFGDLGFVGTLKKLFGGFLGTILALPTFVYFLVFASIGTRIFAETTKLYLLQNTPLEFIILPLLILTIILARAGVEPTARFFEIVTPIVLIVIVFLALVALSDSDFSNIRPTLNEPPMKYLAGIKAGAFAYGGFEVLLILFPFIRKPKQAFKASSIALITITIVYTVIIAETLAKFGPEQTSSLIYPTMTMMQASAVPGGFLERLEGLLLAMWVVFVFTTQVAMMFSFSVIGGDLLKQRQKRHIIPIFLPALYLIALAGESVVQLFKMSDVLLTFLGAYTVIFLPLLMLIASMVRKR